MVFAGIEGVHLDAPNELDPEILVRPVYAHLFSPMMLASRPPPPEGGPHGSPWFACHGGHRAFDVLVELELRDRNMAIDDNGALKIHWYAASTLRLQLRQPVRFAALCAESFNGLVDAVERKPRIAILELEGIFRLGQSIDLSPHVSEWKRLWPVVMEAAADERFGRALRYLDSAWFATSLAAASIATWTALEALLLDPFTQGIKKSISKRIADLLADRAVDRVKMAAKVTQLYEVRCDAAHEAKGPDLSHVMEGLELACDVFLAVAAAKQGSTNEKAGQSGSEG